MENQGRSFIAGTIVFFTGVMVGVCAGILMAPQSGDRTRRKIQDLAADVQEDAETFMKDTKEKVSDWVDRSRKFVGKP